MVTRPSTTRPAALLLALLVVASFALCLWYAGHELHSGRFWDERFSIQNVRGVLWSGWIRPVNGYYQTLSYLPQAVLLGSTEALHGWTGAEGLAVFRDDGSLSPTAFFLCRLLQSLYGAGCLVMTFILGRRLASPAVGLLGALFLAATPWHVQASAVFKPDVLLALTVLVAVWWSLRALEAPSLRRFALAGGGVALALSAKLTGAVAAIPVAVAAFGATGTWRQRLARLLAAGGAGGALFVLLNPYFPIYPSFFSRNLDHYARRAESYGGTRLEVLLQQVELVAGPSVHGPIVGGLALGAGALFGLHLVRRARREGLPAGADGWVFLSFPVAFGLAYAAFTSHFKGNNFVPLFPFTSLLAAWGVAGIWGRVVRSSTDRVRRRLTALATAGLVLALAPRPFLFAYREVVPTTEEVALRFLVSRLRAAEEVDVRAVLSDRGDDAGEGLLVGGPPPDLDLVLVPMDPSTGVGGPVPDRADGEIVTAARLEGEGGERFWSRVARVPPGSVRRFEAGPFRARGPERIAVAHPWRQVGPGTALPGGRQPASGRGWLFSLPSGLGPGEVVSFVVWGEPSGVEPALELGDRRLPLWRIWRSGAARTFASERIRLDVPTGTVRLLGIGDGSGEEPGSEAPPGVELLRWAPPSAHP